LHPLGGVKRDPHGLLCTPGNGADQGLWGYNKPALLDRRVRHP
jgi:hypothetical protein